MSSWPGFYSGFKLTILLSSSCWDCKCVQTCPAPFILSRRDAFLSLAITTTEYPTGGNLGGEGLCIGSQFKGCGQSWWSHGYRWVCGTGRMDTVGCVLLTSRWIRKRRDSLLLVRPHILKVPPSLQTAPAFRDHIVRPRQDIFHSKLKRRWQEIGSCYQDLLLKMLILTNCTPGSSRGCQSNSHECDRLVWQDTGWPSSSELGTVYNPHPCTHTFIHTHMLRASYSHPIQVNLEL